MELIGRCGADGVLRYLPAGSPVLEMNVADNKKIKEKQTTQWFKVVLFGDLAEMYATEVKKGMEIWAVGTYERRSVEKDGKTQYFEQLNASYFRICHRLTKQEEYDI